MEIKDLLGILPELIKDIEDKISKLDSNNDVDYSVIKYLRGRVDSYRAMWDMLNSYGLY